MAENYLFPQQRGPSTTPPNLPHICSGKTRPPHFPTPCTIEWAALRDVELLRHGTGTSLYTATFQGDAVVVKTPAVGLKAQAIFDVTTELQHEAAVLAGLSHPNIVRFYGHGTIHYGDTVVYFIVVERLMGGTIHDQIKASKERNIRVRSEQALPHLAGIADALWYLHRAAAPAHIVCHRDLKPDNIGFTGDGVVKLFDYGLCAIIPHKQHSHLSSHEQSLDRGSAHSHSPDGGGGGGGAQQQQQSLAPVQEGNTRRSVQRAQTEVMLSPFNDPIPQVSDSRSSSVSGGDVSDSAAGRGGGGGGGPGMVDDDGPGAPTPALVEDKEFRQGGNTAATTPTTPGRIGGGSLLDVLTFGVGVLAPPGTAGRACKLRGQTGSIRYMAPEVALGGLYDESIDPFSLSLVAWEMLHLRKPFQGLNVEAHRRVVCLGGGREEIDRQVPGPLADLLRACWQTDPADRPSSLQMCRALAAMVAPRRLPFPSMAKMQRHLELLDQHDKWQKQQLQEQQQAQQEEEAKRLNQYHNNGAGANNGGQQQQRNSGGAIRGERVGSGGRLLGMFSRLVPGGGKRGSSTGGGHDTPLPSEGQGGSSSSSSSSSAARAAANGGGGGYVGFLPAAQPPAGGLPPVGNNPHQSWQQQQQPQPQPLLLTPLQQPPQQQQPPYHQQHQPSILGGPVGAANSSGGLFGNRGAVMPVDHP